MSRKRTRRSVSLESETGFQASPSLESLEPRLLLNGTLSIVDGELFYTAGDGVANAVTLNESGTDYVLTDTGEEITLGAGMGNWALSNGNHTATGPQSDITADTMSIALGDGDDSLTVDSTNGAVTVPIHYNGGVDNDSLTLTGGTATAATYTVGPVEGAGTSTIVIGGETQTVNFEGIEPVIDLVAGSLVVNATDADNAISYAVGSVATRGLVTVDNFESIEFSNKTTLTINGQAGSDVISLNNPNTPTGLTAININGDDPTGSDSDTLMLNGTSGVDTINFAPTATGTATITGAGPVAITANTVEQVVLDGAGGSDVLTVTTPAGANTVTYTPGATVDAASVQVASLLPLSFENLGAGSVALADTGGSRVDSLVYNGTSANDTFTLAVTTGAITLNSQLAVTTPGVSTLTLNSLEGDDTFNITGDQPYTTTNVDAGSPSASDIVNLTGDSSAVTATIGDGTATVTGGGLGTVNLVGTEELNVDAATGDLTVQGTTGDDTATVTPTGAATGTVQANDASPVLDFANVGTFAVDLLAGVDEMTVIGTQIADTITVTGSLVTVDPGTARETVNYSNVEILNIQTFGGDDAIDLTPDAAVLMFVDGGTPSGSVNGDSLTVNAGGAAASYEGGPENDEGTIRVTGAQPVGFDHIELPSISGASSATITGTNGNDIITVIARDSSTHTGADGVQDFTSTVNDGAEVLWLDVAAAQVDALSGNDDVVLQTPAPNSAEWDVDITINGGSPSASDRLIVETPGTDTVNFTPTSADTGTLVIDEPGNDTNVTITGIEELIYDGEAGNDTLTVIGSGTFTYRPDRMVDYGSVQLDSDMLLTFERLGTTGTVTINGTGGSDTLVYDGTEDNDAFTVAATTGTVNLVSWAGDHVDVLQTGVENLVLNGLAGDDTFAVTDPMPYTTVEFHGGLPSASDSATVTGTAGDDTITLDLDAETVTGLGAPIQLSGIEDLTINGGGGTDTMNVTEVGAISDFNEVDLNFAGSSALNATGTTGDDIIDVTPTGAGAGSFIAEDVAGPVVTYDGFGGAFTVNGGSAAGYDVLTILGTQDADTATSTATAVTISGGAVTLGTNLDRMDLFTFAGNDSVDLDLQVAGVEKVIDVGTGDDTVDLSDALDGTIYGGEGDDTLTGSPADDLIYGGQGNDTLLGLAGDDRLEGQEGDDTLTGGEDDDDLFGGDNSDTIIWADGDGSDLVEGGDGNDELQVNSAGGADVFTIDRVGRRVSLARTNLVTFGLDIAQIEQLDLDMSGGADTLTVTDLTDTDLLLMNVDVGAGDGATDSVVVNGTTGPDIVEIAVDGSVVDIKRLFTRIRLANTSVADADALRVNGNAGDDSIKSEFPTESLVNITLSGGTGDDYLSADAVLLGGDGDDTLVSGFGDDTIDGGAGIDRVVARGDGDINFVLTDASLTGLATTGTATGTDSLTSIEEAQLEGGTLANTFDIGAFTGHVILLGGQGSDTVDFNASPSEVTVDLDLTDFTHQSVNNNGLTLELTDPIENVVGSPYNDVFFVDGLEVARYVDGNSPTTGDAYDPTRPIPPGDQLTFDGQREFVTVIRTDVDSGTTTAFGYQPVTFDDIEKLAVVNTLGTTGLGGFDIQAYTAAVNYPVAVRGWSSGAMAVGDLNGDGWQDIVVLNKRSRSTMSVLLGDGDGSYGDAVRYATGGRLSWDVDLADITGPLDVPDGVLDAIITNKRSHTVTILPGDGAGGFGAATAYTTRPTRQTGKGPKSLVIADLDDDGNVDVVTANSGWRSSVSVLMGNGAGGLAAPTAYLTGGRGLRDLDLVDVDVDGDEDILASHKNSADIRVMLNDGAGGFGAATAFASNTRMTSVVARDNNGSYLDFNLDGNPDVAVSNIAGNTLSVFLGDGAGTFDVQVQTRYPLKSSEAIMAGDFNSDGKVDIVLTHDVSNVITILLGNGNGTFSDPYEFRIGGSIFRNPAAIALGDFNNDGGIDIVVANGVAKGVSVLLRNLVI